MTQMQKNIKKEKMQKVGKTLTQMMSFLQNQKNPETETFLFCIITFEPIKI